MKRWLGLPDGQKVKMLNIIGTPNGVITFGEALYPNAGSLNGYFGVMKYWVRLDTGVLLKDVMNSEIELIKPKVV